jgi:hypothetical protein
MNTTIQQLPEHQAPATPEQHDAPPLDTVAAPVSEEDVREFYRLLLDREAESEAIVAAKAGQPIKAILAEFILSQEFCEKNHEYLMLLFI